MRVRVMFIVSVMTLFALAGGNAFAQTETGRIGGTVTDQQGSVVPGVTVTATAVSTGVVRTTTTDHDGKYVLANLQPASYDIKFQLAGFKGVGMKLQLQVGGSLSADAKLEVGGTSETVTVTAAPDVVNTSNSEVSTVVRESEIRDMPNLERNPYSLVQLSGNVQDTPIEETLRNNVPRGVGFNVNGGRSSGTHILLDGASNNFEFDTTVGQHVPLDSVQEFSVVTNNFSSQYGRATGGVVNLITKSGTNSLIGTGYDFYRTEKFATNSPDNIANGVQKGHFTRNQPGYSLGGPILKDKAHFFSSLEVINITSSSQASSPAPPHGPRVWPTK